MDELQNKELNVNECKNILKCRFGNKIFSLYICIKLKEGYVPPFFCTLLLKISSKEGKITFEVRKISFKEKNFFFEEGKIRSYFGEFYTQYLTF